MALCIPETIFWRQKLRDKDGWRHFRFGAKFLRATKSRRRTVAPKTALAPKKVAPSGLLAPEFILAPVFWRQKWFLAPKSQKLAPKIGHLGPWPFYPNKRQLAPIGANDWRQFGANLAPIAHRQYIGANWRCSSPNWRQLVRKT